MNAMLLFISALGFVALTTAQDPVAPVAAGAPIAVPATVPAVSNDAPASDPTSRALYANRQGYANQPRPNPTVVYNQQQQSNYQNQGQNQQNQQYTQQQGLSAVDASRQLIAAAIAQGANPNNFGVQTNARYNIANQANPQNPLVWEALDALRGRAALTIEEILNILAYAVAGKDYPTYNEIPNTRFSCENVKQAGFYADIDAQCQAIRRCDINGVMWSYLCPNMTLFNQITLVCDWFFNVNCAYATQYYDYSNPRLYTQFELLDTPRNVAYPNNYPTNNYPTSGPNRPNYPQTSPVRPAYPQPNTYRS